MLQSASWLDSFELTVSIAELTNLELLKKGLYRVAIGIRGGENAAVSACSASPARLTSTSRSVHCDESDAGYEPQTVTSDGVYLSRAVFCRYIDEAFDMTETATFTFDMADSSAAAVADAAEGVTITFALQRAEYAVPQPEKGGKGGAAAAAGPFPGAPPPDRAGRRRLTPFTEVSRREVPLARASLLGLQCYLPILWDSMNLALAGVSLFCCQVGRRLALPPPVPGPKAAPTAAASVQQPVGSSGSAVVTAAVDAASSAASGDGGSGSGSGFFGWAMRKIRHSAAAVFSDRPSDSEAGGASGSSSAAAAAAAREREAAAADFNLAVARYDATPLSHAEALFPRWMAHCRQHAAAVRAAAASAAAAFAAAPADALTAGGQAQQPKEDAPLRLAAAVAGASTSATSDDACLAATGASKSPRGARRSLTGLG